MKEITVVPTRADVVAAAAPPPAVLDVIGPALLAELDRTPVVSVADVPTWRFVRENADGTWTIAVPE